MNHSFNIDIAVTYGIPCAVILEHIWFWIAKNEADGRHFHDGTYWTYSSVKAFSKLFPYLSEKQIRGALEKLKSEGILKTGNFNEEAYDRTLWYALTEKGKSICPTGQSPVPSRGNPFALQGEPIPDITTDIDNRYSEKEKEERAREEPDFGTPWDRFVQAYEQNIGLMPTSMVELGDLQLFFDEFGPDVLTEVIALTARKHVENPHSYFARICRSWLGKGITTADQAKAAIKDFERQKKGGRRNGTGDGNTGGEAGQGLRYGTVL